MVTENEGRFSRIVISNTGLPTGEEPMSPAFLMWKRMATEMLETGDMPVGTLVSTSARMPDSKEAYDAPFSDKRFRAGPLMLSCGPELAQVISDFIVKTPATV